MVLFVQTISGRDFHDRIRGIGVVRGSVHFLCVLSALIHGGSQLPQVLGDGFVGFAFLFVFEGDVAAVVGVAEDLEDAIEVGGVFAAAFFGDFGLDLDGNGLGGEFGDVFVGVVVPVAGIEVDAEPFVVDGVEHGQDVVGGFDEVSVVLDGEEHGACSRVIADFLESFDGLLEVAVAVGVFGFASGEDSDDGGAEFYCVFDPAFGVLDLLAVFGLVGVAEVVADGGAGDVEAEQEGFAFESVEVVVFLALEVVGGGFDGVESPAGGHVAEVEQGHCAGLSVVGQVIAEGVGGDAEFDL